MSGSHGPHRCSLAVAAIALLIIFTGYLIIYNVFQISVAGDIRFYGLLKTIGTTPTAAAADHPPAGSCLKRRRYSHRSGNWLAHRRTADAGNHSPA